MEILSKAAKRFIKSVPKRSQAVTGVKKRGTTILAPCAGNQREIIEVFKREDLFRKGKNII